MKRRTFLKSLAASVAGLFCASAAAKKPEPEKFADMILMEDAAVYCDDRYWVRGGGITADEMRAIEAQYESHERAKGH